MKEAKKIKFWQSIRTKLICTMVAVAAIPLIVSLIISYNNSVNKAVADAEEMLGWQNKFLLAEFDSIVKENLRTIQTVAASPETIAYVEGDKDLEDDVLEQLISIDNILADGNSTVITGADGMNLVRSSGNLVDIAERQYFKEGMAGKLYVSDIIVSKSTGARMVSIVAPIYGSDGSVIGTIHRNYNTNALHDFLAEEAEDAFFVDCTGMVVAHSQYEITADNPEDRSTSQFMTSGKDTGLYTSDTGKGYSAMISYEKDPLSGWTVVVAENQTEVMSTARSSAAVVLIVGIILLIGAAVISVFMANSLTAPIGEVNTSLGALADGRFQSITRFTGRKDEFGEIINETNDVIEKLKEIVSDIKASANGVSNSSAELADTADQISQTCDDVSEAVQEIASGATQQADEIQHATESIQVISNNIESVTANAASLSSTAESMDEGSKSSRKELEDLQKSSGEMDSSIIKIMDTINATKNAVDNISSKVEVIDSIASQTSLLALNASIEAARAGEAGRGFAVVAEEIGQLAENSAKSANEIKKEMEVLLRDSTQAVHVAEEVGKITKDQQSVLQNTVGSIQDLIDQIASTVTGVEDINGNAEACNDSRAVVVDAMNSLSAISEENAAASQETSASMEELNATVNTLAASAGSLKDIAEALIKDMEFFKD